MGKQKNILILTSWSFEDALIQTYTLPYVRMIQKNIPEGSKIFLHTQKKKSYELNKVENDIQKDELKKQNIFVLETMYNRFGALALINYFFTCIRLFFLCFFKNISYIHTWCTPAGAMGYLLSIFTGKKLILDSFEPHAEAMKEGGTWKASGVAYRLLFFLEKKQLKRASEVICAVAGMEAHSQHIYGIKKSRYFAKPACVDLDFFSEKNIKNKELENELSLKDKIVCVYAGKFGGLYLEKETFDFFKIAFDHWGDKFRILLLTNHSETEIENYAAQSGVPLSIITQRFVPYKKIPVYMGLGDFAICPMKPLPSRRYGTPIKDGEYWALGLPIVIPNQISDDSQIIKERKIGSILAGLNSDCYKHSVLEIQNLLNEKSRMEMYNLIRPIAEKYRNFTIAENVYKTIYKNENVS